MKEDLGIRIEGLGGDPPSSHLLIVWGKVTLRAESQSSERINHAIIRIIMNLLHSDARASYLPNTSVPRDPDCSFSGRKAGSQGRPDLLLYGTGWWALGFSRPPGWPP